MQSTLSTPLLLRLSDLLAVHMGLHFPVDRWGDLERGITAAAPAFGMADAKSCAQHLLSAPLTHREVEILASFLTVGETYFFRENRSFEVLEQHILPALLRACEGTDQRRLRIWSAGCCTGEEAYSIAMILDRLIPNIEAWNITLLATDINPAFLRKAAEGEYNDWSFRSTPDWIRNRYFQHRKNGHFRLDARISKRVTFNYLNLADDVYPSLTNNTNAMDVIFCRNVLMYFSAERARTVIEKLRHALVEGGWLIVSPVETSVTLFSGFTSVEFAGVTLYRKDTRAEVPHFVHSESVPVMDYFPEFPCISQENTSPEPMPVMDAFAENMPVTSPSSGAISNSATIPQTPPSRKARDCANQGQLGEAAEWCCQAINADKLNPAHYYLLSAIQQEQGLRDEAARSLMRALYLDPNFVLAHYALGNLCQAQGRGREALRHFDNALALLQAHSPDELLPESDGLTAGRIMEIIASMRSSMPQLTASL